MQTYIKKIGSLVVTALLLCTGVLNVHAQGTLSGITYQGSTIKEYAFVTNGNWVQFTFADRAPIVSQSPLTTQTNLSYLDFVFDPGDMTITHVYKQDAVAEIASGFENSNGVGIKQVEFKNGQAELVYADGTKGSVSGDTLYFSKGGGTLRIVAGDTTRKLVYSAPSVAVMSALPNSSDGPTTGGITNQTSSGSGTNQTSGGTSDQTSSGSGTNQTSGGTSGQTSGGSGTNQTGEPAGLPGDTGGSNGSNLPGDTGPQTTPPKGLSNPLKVSSFPAFIDLLFKKIVLPIGTSIVVLFIIYSGFLFVVAQGNEDKLRDAKQTFTWTVVGAAILLGASVIAEIVKNTINQLT